MSDRMAFANDLFSLLTLTSQRVTSQPTAGGPIGLGLGYRPKATPSASPMIFSAGAAAAAGPAVQPVATRMMLADAKFVNQPVLRNSKLFAGDVDWHQYMTRLSLMLK